MDDDPRLLELDGKLAGLPICISRSAARGRLRGRVVVVHTKLHGERLNLFGEVFDDGDADISYKWTDRLAGIAGADIDVRGASLQQGSRVRPTSVRGSVIGSGSVRRGGVVSGQVVVDALPISRIDLLGKNAAKAEGTISGVVSASGTSTRGPRTGRWMRRPCAFEGRVSGRPGSRST